MAETDAEATARAEADPMGRDVLDAVDVGGTWTVTGDGDPAPPPPAPPPPAKPSAPTTSSDLAERPPAPMAAPPPPPDPVTPEPSSKPVLRRRQAASSVRAEYHRSPDGRWWWDGRQWQPVQPDRAGTGRPGGGRRLVAAAIVAGVAVAVPLAVGAGVFAYRATNAPAPRSAAAPIRYLADASSTRIELAATARGLRCATPPQSVGSGANTTVRVCQRVSVGRVATVAMVGHDPSHLLAVTAGVGGAQADEPADLALLEAIIGATVARGSAAADDSWLSAHFDQSGDSQTVVKGVTLRLTVRDSVRSLAIVPAY